MFSFSKYFPCCFSHLWTKYSPPFPSKFFFSSVGLRRKVWTQTKILRHSIHYFVAILRFVTISAPFGRLWAKKVLVWVKPVFLGQEVQYCLAVYIAYYTEIDLQICNYAQKWRICRENSKYAPDKFCGHLCIRRKDANFCHPVRGDQMFYSFSFSVFVSSV